jgi:hypothetical protein
MIMVEAWYVELERTEPDTFGREVLADSEETAVDQVLMQAPGTPADWKVVLVERPVHRATGETQRGAAEFDIAAS